MLLGRCPGGEKGRRGRGRRGLNGSGYKLEMDSIYVAAGKDC
jgi:hypothetical protein